MRKAGTALLVAAVVAVAAAALVDAVRHDDPPARATVDRAATTGAGRSAPLARAGVPGDLLVTVRSGRRCELVSVVLRSLARTSYMVDVPCRFAVSPDGRTVPFASGCGRRSTVAVADLLSDVSTRVGRGCRPVWRPSGLTFVRDGTVVGIQRGCDPVRADCVVELLVPRDALVAAVAATEGPGGRPPAAVALAWLTETRALVVATGTNQQRLLAFDRGNPKRPANAGWPAGTILDVAVDEDGGWVVTRFEDDSRSAYLVDSRGQMTGVRGPRDLRAVAVSPDGRWLARARPGSVCVFRRTEPDLSVGCLDMDAVDLAWR